MWGYCSSPHLSVRGVQKEKGYLKHSGSIFLVFSCLTRCVCVCVCLCVCVCVCLYADMRVNVWCCMWTYMCVVVFVHYLCIYVQTAEHFLPQGTKWSLPETTFTFSASSIHETGVDGNRETLLPGTRELERNIQLSSLVRYTRPALMWEKTKIILVVLEGLPTGNIYAFRCISFHTHFR